MKQISPHQHLSTACVHVYSYKYSCGNPTALQNLRNLLHHCTLFANDVCRSSEVSWTLNNEESKHILPSPLNYFAHNSVVPVLIWVGVKGRLKVGGPSSPQLPPPGSELLQG